MRVFVCVWIWKCIYYPKLSVPICSLGEFWARNMKLLCVLTKKNVYNSMNCQRTAKMWAKLNTVYVYAARKEHVWLYLLLLLFYSIFFCEFTYNRDTTGTTSLFFSVTHQTSKQMSKRATRYCVASVCCMFRSVRRNILAHY